MPALSDRIILYRFLLVVAIFATATGLAVVAEEGVLTRTVLALLAPIGLVSLLSVAYLVLILRVPKLRLSRGFVAIQFVIDAVILTIPVYYTQGTESPFIALYILLIVAAALGHSTRFALTLALLAGALLSGIAYLESVGQVPGVFAGRSPDVIGRTLLRLFVYFGLFGLLGVLPGGIVDRLRRTDEALAYVRRDYGLIRELHGMIVEQVPSGIALLDGQRRLILLNRAGARILGTQRLAEQRALLERLEEAAQVQPLSELMLELGGQSRTLGFTVTPIDGEWLPGGQLIIFQDVTERRRLERDFEVNRRLAALGKLSANLAHELRNPLAALSNSVQILAAGDAGNEEDAGRLHAIQLRELARLERLVADFLRYARPPVAELRSVDLATLIGEVLERYREHPDLADRRVALDYSPDLGRIRTDPELWRQSFGNVLLNACQWTPAGGVVRVQARRSGAGVEVSVRDQGPGISEADQAQLFEPFFGRRQGGTGLGLAIAWSAIQALGGRLDLDETGPEGSVFKLRLPDSPGAGHAGTDA